MVASMAAVHGCGRVFSVCGLLVPRNRLFENLMLWAPTFACCGWVRTREFRDPIRLPCTVIVRKSLLPTSMIVVELSPSVLGLYRSTVINILAVEFALRTVEASEYSRIHLASPAADITDRPLLFLQIECAQRKTCTALRR